LKPVEDGTQTVERGDQIVAHVIFLPYEGQEFKFFNVDQAVGSSASNRRDDVLLVQYLLLKIYNHPSTRSSRPKGEMKTDGAFGPISRNWILKFQLDVGAAMGPGNIVFDARVDPAKGLESTISKTPYTVLHLSRAFERRYPEFYEQPARDPELPVELRDRLELPAVQSINVTMLPLVRQIASLRV
jgi:hypothetical protein